MTHWKETRATMTNGRRIRAYRRIEPRLDLDRALAWATGLLVSFGAVAFVWIYLIAPIIAAAARPFGSH